MRTWGSRVHSCRISVGGLNSKERRICFRWLCVGIRGGRRKKGWTISILDGGVVMYICEMTLDETGSRVEIC